jgi:hypothetical protein
MPSLPGDIAEVFARFAKAVQDDDEAAYCAVLAPDVLPQPELFHRNAANVRSGNLRMHLRRVDVEGPVATVFFDLLGPRGAADGGAVSLTLETAGWRLRQL